MSTQAFSKGDKVTVTLEGTVTNIVPFEGDRIELRIVDETGHQFYVAPDSKNVQKVEPEYEVFGPGDVVRAKHVGEIDDYSRVLGTEGYILIEQGDFHEYEGAFALAREDFTSEKFERVDLS